MLIKKGKEFENMNMRSWEDIDSFDDLVLEKERKIISDLEKEIKKTKRPKNKCPHLRKEGKFFYYCAYKLDMRQVKDKRPSPSNPLYKRKVGCVELQLHCLEAYQNCCFISGTLKW